MEERKKQEIQVKMPDNLIGGVFANNVIISHTREEFIMTFVVVVPPVGTVTSRVIMSPGHMKRFISALQANVKLYEDKIGKITEAPEPRGQLGFSKPS